MRLVKKIRYQRQYNTIGKAEKHFLALVYYTYIWYIFDCNQMKTNFVYKQPLLKQREEMNN